MGTASASGFRGVSVTIAPGGHNYLQQEILATGGPLKALSLTTIYTWGKYYTGRLNSGNRKLQFAPIPYISLTALYNRNNFMPAGAAKLCFAAILLNQILRP